MTSQERTWLAFYEEGVPENVDYEEVCLPDFLDRSAQMFPDNIALLFQGYQLTYQELKEMVGDAAYLTVYDDPILYLMPDQMEIE